MTRQNTDPDKQQGEQRGAMNRLQEDENEYAKTQQDDEPQMNACAYLIHIGIYQAMCRTDQKQDKCVSERGDLPLVKLIEADGIERCQIAERLIEQLHVAVEESVSEQKPIGQSPTDERGKETPESQRLKVESAYKQDRRQQGDLRKDKTPQPDKQESMKQIARCFGRLIGIEKQIERDHECQRGQIARAEVLHHRAGGDQQQVERCLHRSPRAYQPEGVVHQDEQIADGEIDQEANGFVGPHRYGKGNDGFPERMRHSLVLYVGEKKVDPDPTQDGDEDRQRKCEPPGHDRCL